MRILVIEDEKKLAESIRDSFAAEHYEVTLAYTGEDGFFRINAELFDLVVLDLDPVVRRVRLVVLAAVVAGLVVLRRRGG